MQVHNVRDGRHGCIGSFEAEPLDYDALGPEHVGRTVIYRDHGRAEAGTITSWRDGKVWARYSRGDTAAGADAGDLLLAVRSLTKELTDADFCPLCGVCLPPEDRCTSDSFKGKICPHAEANAAQANL